jgi:hypothetical protein
MFSKFWADYLNITSNLMPLLQQYSVDYYMCGHEHDMTYAFFPYSQVPHFLSSMKAEAESHARMHPDKLEAGY